MRTPTSTRSFTAPLWLGLGALVAALLFVATGAGDATAEPTGPVETQYLSVTGEGPTAKAWYEGAQPSGIPLQRALSTFNKQGFHVVTVTEPHPAKAGNGEWVWAILMEKKR
ncbi:MAG: hypothetical protein QNJ98_06255 [Planctomycetota bacterium]|nr:hypothetical protein [Planctomycetota bacterium]